MLLQKFLQDVAAVQFDQAENTIKVASLPTFCDYDIYLTIPFANKEIFCKRQIPAVFTKYRHFSKLRL